MGEVYQAHDTKLGRDVAIKVLPEAFAHDAERLSRFQREAKMLAALNHPNIATIYGLEDSNGTSYLVMELVPGETLAERIKRDGAVPIEEALAIAKQIAEALEAAHEKGIIHRDLKPANVKLTPEGKVKVSGFRLGESVRGRRSNGRHEQLTDAEHGGDDAGSDSRHRCVHESRAGQGQSGGQAHRHLGVRRVLYELLTGKQAFHGEDVDGHSGSRGEERNRIGTACREATPPSIRDSVASLPAER